MHHSPDGGKILFTLKLFPYRLIPWDVVVVANQMAQSVQQPIANQGFPNDLHGTGLQGLVGNIPVGRAREDHYREIDTLVPQPPQERQAAHTG